MLRIDETRNGTSVVCILLPTMNNVSDRQTLEQSGQESSCVVCAPSPASPMFLPGLISTGLDFQTGELKLINKSPLHRWILTDCIEWTNFETKSLKGHKNASYVLCLGDISLKFWWLKVKCLVEGGRLCSSIENKRYNDLENVIPHFVSVDSAFCIKSHRVNEQ